MQRIYFFQQESKNPSAFPEARQAYSTADIKIPAMTHILQSGTSQVLAIMNFYKLLSRIQHLGNFFTGVAKLFYAADISKYTVFCTAPPS